MLIFKNKILAFYTLLSLGVSLIQVPVQVALAQSMNSTNYNLENSSFNSGGDSSSSTNYRSQDSMGDANDESSSSTNYKVLPGTIQPVYPEVPPSPTLTNTGGALYGSLDFIISPGSTNASDVQYAIAISSDNFTTTNFIQVDNTVASSVAWQTYANWGSSTGERVTGLLAGTTYKIKVKARFQVDSETIYSGEASASTASATISVSFSGTNSGVGMYGTMTNVSSSPNTLSFGTVVPGTTKVIAQSFTVSTNAASGYTTTIQQDKDLTQQNNKTIDPVSGTNASPTAFPTSVSRGAFGYHTSDSTLCTGTQGRFENNDTYAKITTTPLEIACSNSPVTSQVTDMVYKLLIGQLQEAGQYQNRLTFITTGTY